jgi:hypothetical protein
MTFAISVYVWPLIKVSLSQFNFTGEMLPMFMVGFYPEYIFVGAIWIMFILLLRYHKKNNTLKDMFTNVNNFIFIGFFLGFIASQMNFRNNIFLLPFIFLMVGYIFSQIDDAEIFKAGFLLIFFIVCMLISIDNIYLREAPMNSNDYQLIEYISNNNFFEKECLIGMWDKGYYYDY